MSDGDSVFRTSTARSCSFARLWSAARAGSRPSRRKARSIASSTAFELAWKALNDYLIESGVVVSPVTPRQVIKDAFAAKLLDDGQLWMDMLVERNSWPTPMTRRSYDKSVEAIHVRYLPALASVHDWFSGRMADEPGRSAVPFELDQLCSVFRRHPEISQVKVFGSRAKGTTSAVSDVDLAVWGVADDLAAQLSLSNSTSCLCPTNYDVKAFAAITLASLREHIERVGTAGSGRSDLAVNFSRRRGARPASRARARFG